MVAASVLLPTVIFILGLAVVMVDGAWSAGIAPLLGALTAICVALAVAMWRQGARVAAAVAAGEDAQADAVRIEARLRDAVDSYADGFMLFDAADRLIVANKAMRRLYPIMWRHCRSGRTYEEIMRASWRDGGLSMGEPQGEDYIAMRLASHRNPGKPILRRTQGGRWLEIVDYRTREGGTVTRLVDLTDRIEAQTEQHRAEERLVEAIGSMDQGFALFDPDDRLVVCNDAFILSFEGAESAVVPGASYESILRAGVERRAFGDDLSGEVAIGQALRRHREGYGSKVERRTPSGRWILAYDRVTSGGQIVCLRTDITEMKRIQEQLQARVTELETNQEAMRLQAAELQHLAREIARARDVADTANRAKTDFLAMMSHELRTPLNAILGFSELLRSQIFGPLGSPQYLEYSNDIYNSGEHLLSLINDLLDLAKVESGMSQLRESEVSVPLLVSQSVRMVRERAAKGGVKLLERTASDLPMLLADERRVVQILVNLLSNAVKFTPQGGTVIVSADRDENGGVTISVADTGIGIPSHALQRVMEPFYQADSTLTRPFEGTGLGLPLARQLAEAHGATLVLQSAPDIGTTARLRFPPSRSIEAPRGKIAASA